MTYPHYIPNEILDIADDHGADVTHYDVTAGDDVYTARYLTGGDVATLAEAYEDDGYAVDVVDGAVHIAHAPTLAIDGDVYDEYDVEDHDEYGYSALLLTRGREDWVIFASAEDAGKAARAYWAEMAQHDPSEIRCIVGDKTLVAWALGARGGPGSTQVRSLNEWLDLWLDTPEEHHAGYDGAEHAAYLSPAMQKRTGFPSACVAYRRN